MSNATSRKFIKKFRENYEVVKSTIGFSQDGGLAQQQFRDECDINSLMKKYEKTGALPGMIKSNPRYGDFSSPLSYQESLNVVMKAQEQFAALDAPIRARFENDPEKFLAFVNDSKNQDELIKMGLATDKRPPKEPAVSDKKPKAPAAGEGPDA